MTYLNASKRSTVTAAESVRFAKFRQSTGRGVQGLRRSHRVTTVCQKPPDGRTAPDRGNAN